MFLVYYLRGAAFWHHSSPTTLPFVRLRLLSSSTPSPPDDHTTACATCASSVMSRKCSSRTLIHPHPPWWSYDSMCNMLKTQKNQILYPHFRKPHFWNLQPFRGIVNGTSQNWQPLKAPYQPHAKYNHRDHESTIWFKRTRCHQTSWNGWISPGIAGNHKWFKPW